MHNTMIEVDRVQWGVGNGGFHTEDVRIRGFPTQTPLLRVVYDCGTLRRAAVIDGEIQDWFNASGNGATIDAEVSVLVLSHFDRDHVNGIHLLKNAGFYPDHVILPYLNSAARVLQILTSVVAMASSSGDDDRATNEEINADREAGRLAADPEATIGEVWPEASITLVNENSEIFVDAEVSPDREVDLEDEENQVLTTWAVTVHSPWGIEVSAKLNESPSFPRKQIWKYVWREHKPQPTANVSSALRHDLSKALGISLQAVDNPQGTDAGFGDI